MPASQRTLTRQHVQDTVARALAGSDDPHHATRTGVELEWLTSRRADRGARAAEAELRAVLDGVGALPGGGRLSLEPGGQIELSGAPHDDLDDACAATAADLYRLDRACAAAGIELVALGADPERRPARVTTSARYRAMERYFAPAGPDGITMMTNTASVQVNVGCGTGSAGRARWRLANRLGPTLVALFANSPFTGGAPTGWASTRFRTWWALDPSRTAPLDPDADPVDAYTQLVLTARLLFVRHGPDDCRPPVRPCTFGDWLDGSTAAGAEWSPTESDLAEHLTTLFPPVRARGWLELRMIDALPTPYWQVAAATVATLLADDDVRADADRAVAGTTHLWGPAAQAGLAHPALRRAAQACLALTVEALERRDSPLRDAVARYADRFADRGRCPADDRLDAWRRTGDLYPPLRSPLFEPATEPSTSSWGRGDA